MYPETVMHYVMTREWRSLGVSSAAEERTVLYGIYSMPDRSLCLTDLNKIHQIRHEGRNMNKTKARAKLKRLVERGILVESGEGVKYWAFNPMLYLGAVYPELDEDDPPPTSNTYVRSIPEVNEHTAKD